MTPYRRHLPRKVEFARDAIVTFIHDRKLTVGDRLPPYAQLRAEFGLGSQTIAAAVGSLCELGVLEVRDKVGIFVKNPAGGHLAGRTVALVIRHLAGSAYSATLAGFIQKLLNERNCRCLTFFQSTPFELGALSGLDEFPGLEQAAAERRCDGIITFCPFSETALRRLDRLGVKYCFVGDDDQCKMPSGVVIAVREFIDEAATALRNRGCTRLAQLCVSSRQLARRECGVPAFIGSSYDGGAAIADELLATAPEERPDGLISDDDVVVSGLLAELVTRQLPRITYLPYVATIVHKELGERYPSDKLILFEQEIETYAASAVELLMQSLRGRQIEKNQIIYRFRPIATP